MTQPPNPLATDLEILTVARIPTCEPVPFHRILDNDKRHSGKRRMSTFDDVASEQLRVYRAVRRGRMSADQGRALIGMLKVIAQTLALARFPLNVDIPVTRAGPDGPATLPELAAILAALEREQAAGRAPTLMPDGSVLSAPVRPGQEGCGPPVVDGQVSGSPGQP